MRRYGADPAREPDLWLDPCPPSLALPSRARRLPVRFVPYDGTSPYEARRAGAHPRAMNTPAPRAP
ncbi:hypothetical protein [Streptomyces rapamycinicus]|uniref:hypothetical protein n=1 Tax=Streptomyces rapamycinicus TaxID=1226757 RepID=UPI0032D8EE63